MTFSVFFVCVSDTNEAIASISVSKIPSKYQNDGFWQKRPGATRRGWMNLASGGRSCVRLLCGKVHEFFSFFSAEGGYIATINSDRENERMKRWITRQSLRVAWLGIRIANKTAATTLADVKWEDGTPMQSTGVLHWPNPGNLQGYIK